MRKVLGLWVVLALVLGCLAGQLHAQGGKPASKAAAARSGAETAKAKAAPLDINKATKEQLMELPGIGEALSTKIIQGRPYKSKDELVRRKIIPQATYDKIKETIVAHQVK